MKCWQNSTRNLSDKYVGLCWKLASEFIPPYFGFSLQYLKFCGVTFTDFIHKCMASKSNQHFSQQTLPRKSGGFKPGAFLFCWANVAPADPQMYFYINCKSIGGHRPIIPVHFVLFFLADKFFRRQYFGRKIWYIVPEEDKKNNIQNVKIAVGEIRLH